MRLYIGTSGYQYKHWSRVYYPEEMKTGPAMLQYLMGDMNAVEINSTFYSIPTVKRVVGWLKHLLPGQRIAFKMPMSLSHRRRLKMFSNNIPFRSQGINLLNMFMEAVSVVPDAQRAPILLQLPPAYHYRGDQDLERLSVMCQCCLAWQQVLALEVRHSSWAHADVKDLLAEFNFSFVKHDHQDFNVLPSRCRSDNLYIRRHGPFGNYSEAYGHAALELLLNRIIIAGAKNTYVFFNNDIGGHAPIDAIELRTIAAQRGFF